MLEELRRARLESGLDAAREWLRAIFDEELYLRLLEEEHEVVLAGLAVLDKTADELGSLDLVRRVREEKVARQSARLEADDPGLIMARQDLAAARRDVGDLAGALELEEAVHAARERQLPPDHPDLLLAKRNLATTRLELGQLAEAHALFEAVHAAWERLVPPDHPELLIAKQNLAVTRKTLGDLRGGLALEQHVHAARERLLPADDPLLLHAKNNLAVTLYSLGELAHALELHEAVLAAHERRFPPEHPSVLGSKLNLAAVRYSLGDVAGAHDLYEVVHTAWERLLPRDHPDLLLAKTGLGATRLGLGDLEGALVLLEAVHAARQRLLPPDHPHLFLAKQNLALARRSLGDLAGALALEEAVHAARERLFPADHPDLLMAKQNLAATRLELGDGAGALALAEQVVAAREHMLAPDHPDLLLAKQNLAAARIFHGHLARALELGELVHAARERLLPPDHHDLLAVKSNLGATHVLLGDPAAALPFLEAVHAAFERTLTSDHPDLVRARYDLALVRHGLGDCVGALALVRSALAGQLELAAGLHGEAPRRARASALREIQRLAGAVYASEGADSVERERVDGMLFSVLESLRIVSTSTPRIAHDVAQDPALSELRLGLAACRSELNDLSLAPPAEGAQLAAWRTLLIEKGEERDRLEKELRARMARHGKARTVTPAGTVAALAPATALVSYLRYARLLAWDLKTGKEPSELDSLLAFVITPDARVRRIELGACAEIEELATRWRASIGRPLATTSTESGGTEAARGIGMAASGAAAEDELALGTALRERVLDPCLASLGDERIASLHVVLDDFLHLVPIDALPGKDGRRVGETLALRPEISVARLVAPPAEPSAGVMLALGGVDFDAQGAEAALGPALVSATPPVRDSADRSSAAGRFEPLPETRPEVEALARLFAEHHAQEALVLHGQAASKSALHALAPKARYLHVATHGWFAPESFTSMIDSVERESERALFIRAEEDVRGFAPETLCGLALAGANLGANSAGKVPGILTAEELATLDLSHCELAVLSACETNVGLRRAGQGIQSLQAALHAAGARAAITSLWKVDDAATRRLFELFYTRLWRDDLGHADALWRAKMELRAEGLPLSDWGGWVLSGAPD